MGAWLTSLPCPLSFPNDASPYTLTEIVREARNVNSNIYQALFFLMAAHVSVLFLLVVSYALTMPPILCSYQIAWLVWVILPMLSASFLFSPYEPDIMKQFPLRNANESHNWWRLFAYIVLRCFATCAVALTLNGLLLFNLGLPVFAVGGSWLAWTAEMQWQYVFAQNVLLFFLVLCFGKFHASYCIIMVRA
jgi:magnesium-transporting ATPase (P-type)